jgi:hypothetical protein
MVMLLTGSRDDTARCVPDQSAHPSRRRYHCPAVFKYGETMHRHALTGSALLIALLLTACTTAPGKPELTDNLTYDGLAKVKNPTLGDAWIRPYFTLKGYNKLMLEGAGIQYRPIPRNARDTQFPVSEKQQARLREVVGKAFRTELEKSTQFQIVTEPGPDVLTIWGGLIDVVSFVPPDQGNRGGIYLRNVGEATLVLEIRDSESNATLVRVVDRRAADKSVTLKSSTVSNWSEVQQLARFWATQLRQRLDEAATWDE